MRVSSAVPLLVVSVFVLSGCAQGGVVEHAASYAPLPPTSGTFDYQLGEPYEIDGGLDVVARDSTASPDSGAYSICYVNGFQTQPGESAAWLGERSDLLLHDDAGQPVIDPDWPDEYILDPSTAEQRDGILEVMVPIITGCAESGFDAVEIDNLDTFTRFDASTSAGGAGLDESGALELAAAYVDAAHAAGLAIGQKNAAELADRGRAELGFDFAVAEECGAYGECDAYSSAYGDLVLQIEYTDALAGTPAEVCADDSRAPLTVIRDRDLVAPGVPGYFRMQC